jgi:hypothetical protein
MTSFYDSNSDEHIFPEVSGWFIQYSTESGDSDFLQLDEEIRNDAHALEIIEKELEWEWEDGEFYAYVDSWCYVNVEEEQADKAKSLEGVEMITVSDDENSYLIPINLKEEFLQVSEGDPYDTLQEWHEYLIEE